MDKKYTFSDIVLTPYKTSEISSRSECDVLNNDGVLPIIVAPMESCFSISSKERYNKNFYTDLINSKVPYCLPRNFLQTITTESFAEFLDLDLSNVFISISIEEIEDMVFEKSENIIVKKLNFLLDVANGHSNKVINLVRKFKEMYPNNKIMCGNIANPNTIIDYIDAKCDYIRVGIGGGSVCTTSANTGVHYPMASLVKECYEIKNLYNSDIKIVADGGFRNFDEIIKALALGADYVMLGGVFSKMIDTDSPCYFKKIKIPFNIANYLFKKGFTIEKRHIGMSHKEVQKMWGRTNLKTSEGIIKYNKVETTLEKWLDNFKHYLKTSMSYTNSKKLYDFKGVNFIFITNNALNSYKK
jgi:IMP dehydrogenase